HHECQPRKDPLSVDERIDPTAPSYEGKPTCNTVVIGSGIAGLSVPYELAIRGQKVIVLDRGAIAGA
ncbi:FAD-dependent oxidoreductase, partial [Mesorhizobium sp.]|uniref:FAD-dependent oxidoreductase n=1 Tax=Mesorhizobium sp. TaxID=1871066 RepID=UPI00345DA3CF